MNKGIILEAEFFLSSFVWGILLLVLYDCLRIFRGIKHHIWLAIASEDCLFWGVAGILVFQMVYERNNGIIRAFAFGGMVLGMLLYHKLISNFLVEGMISLILKSGKLLNKLIFHLTSPLRFLYSRMQKILEKIGIKLQKVIGKLVGKVKKPLKKRMEKYTIKREEKKLERKKIKEMKKKEKQSSKINLENKTETQTVPKGTFERIEPKEI